MKSLFIKTIALVIGFFSIYSCTSDSKIEAPLVYPNPYKVLEDLNTINNNLSIKVFSRTSAISVGELGYVIKTNDQGVTWQKLDAGTTNTINDLSFISEENGWIAGNAGTIKQTINGGATWIDKAPIAGTLTATENILAVNFLDDKKGICTTSLGKILITTDGGTTWKVKLAKNLAGTADITTALRSIFIKDANTFYIVGNAGVLLKSTDFGETFKVIATTTITNVNNATFYRVRSASENLAYISGSAGIVLKLDLTTDMLKAVNPPVNENMRGIDFIDENIGLVVGNFGLIFKTRDGGQSWSREKSGVSVTLTDVGYWGENLGYVVGSKAVLKTKQE